MARKRADEPAAARPRGRPKSPEGPKPRTPIVVTIRAKPEWEEWLDSLCAALKRNSMVARVERTDAIDVALAQLASKMGLPEPPPRY
jgi:hypothetical protein